MDYGALIVEHWVKSKYVCVGGYRAEDARGDRRQLPVDERLNLV